MGDSHNSCLKCLGKTHHTERCKICKAFCPRTKKERDFRLKQLLMEAVLCPQLALDQQDLAPSASVQSAPASVRYTVPRKDSGQRDLQHRCSLAPQTVEATQHCSHSPVPHKRHRKMGQGLLPCAEVSRAGCHDRGVFVVGIPGAEVIGDSTVNFSPSKGAVKSGACRLS